MYDTRPSNDPIALLMKSLTGGHTTIGAPGRSIFGSSGDTRDFNGSTYTGSTPFTDTLTGKAPFSLFGIDNPQSQPPQPYDDLLAMIAKMGGSGPNQADYEEALKNSAAQIKGAFGAEIGAIKASSKGARKQTRRSKKQIKRMYDALNREYMKDAQGELALGKQVSDQLGQIAATAQGGVTQNADKIINDQAALSKSLGVESAAPSQIASQEQATADTVGRMQEAAQNYASQQEANSGTQQRYLVRGGKNALLEGTNRRADLVQQLQGFLMDNLGKIADVKAKRGQALAANANSVASSTRQASNDAFNHQLAIANLLKGVEDSKYKLQGQTNGPDNSDLIKFLQMLSDMNNSAVQAGGDTKRQDALYQLVSQIAASEYGLGQ